MESTILNLLIQELEFAQAKITGYFLSCVIVTDKGIYSGSNKEHDDPDFTFEHAEINALNKCLQVEKTPHIQKVFLCGKGKVKKLKHYAPCVYCCEKLEPYSLPETQVILVDLLQDNSQTIFSFSELLNSYSFKDPLKVRIDELSLKEDDSMFLRELISGAKDGVDGIFLTGSASGRGGFTSLLRDKLSLSYGDLDLFLVVKQDQLKELKLLILPIVKKFYPNLFCVDREVPDYQNRKGVVLGKSYFRNNDVDEPVLDFTYSSKLDGSFIRREYFERNWYIELVD